MRDNNFFKMLIMMLALSLLLFGCSDFGDDDDDDEAPTVEATATETGRLAQGYVKNATIIADKIVANGVGNFVLDDDEYSTTSDDNGDFTIQVPEGYGEYVLFSRGGTVTDSEGSEVPASPMLAPAGSDNITPVTSLVALNPDLADSLGEGYDADIADPNGVSGDILQLAKVAESILDAFTDEDSPVVTDIDDMVAIMDELADQLAAGDDLSDDSIVAAAEAAVTNVLADPDIVGTDTITDADAIVSGIGDMVSNVVNTIDETVSTVESTVLASVESAVSTAATTVASSSNTVSIKVTAVAAKDANDQAVASMTTANPSVTISGTDADTIEFLDFTLSANNEFSTTKTYAGASLLITVTDADSLREATVEITNVTVSVTAADVVSLQTSTATSLVVNGKNVNGEVVQVEFENIATQTDQEIISVAGNIVSVDLIAIEDKIQSEVGADEDLFEVSVYGDYTFSSSADEVPLGSFNAELLVQ